MSSIFLCIAVETSLGGRTDGDLIRPMCAMFLSIAVVTSVGGRAEHSRTKKTHTHTILEKSFR